MAYPLYLVMAVCLAGDAPTLPPAVAASPCDCAAPCGSPCDPCGCEHLSLRERLRGLFHGHHGCETTCCTTPCDSCCPPRAAVVEAPKLPKETGPQQVAFKPETPAFQIKPAYLPKVGSAPDYSWVTGQLFYIHADGGTWIIRYAPIDREDRYGGGMVLAPAINMNNFREGDLVTIHGEILNEGRASKYLGGPLYRTLSAELIERDATH